MYLFAIIVFLRLLKYMQIMPCQTISVFCPFDIGVLCFLWHIDFIKDWKSCEFISFEFAHDHWWFCSVEIYGSTVSKEHPIFYDFLHRFWNMYLILRANLAHHRNCIINHFYFGWNCDLLCLNKHCC